MRLLARARAVPKFVQDGRSAGQLLESFTGIVVAVDPEKRYATEKQCLDQRDGMVRAVLEGIPTRFHTRELRENLTYILRVRTWGTGAGSFEFAHFSDAEIAQALRECDQVTPPAKSVLEAKLSRVRTLGEDVSRVWKDWHRQPSKRELAECLWPTLVTRLSPSRRDGEVPLADILSEALDLSAELRRVTYVALGVEEPAPGE